MRDELRRNNTLRSEYAAVKLALASGPDMGIDTYIARKSEVLQRVLTHEPSSVIAAAYHVSHGRSG